MRLPRRVYATYLWVLAGFRTISLRPSATDRLIADLKAAAADCPRDGRTPNTNPERGTKS